MTQTLDELIDIRKEAVAMKDYKRKDEIRNILDANLIFVFDAPWGQEVHYLTDKFFRRKPDGVSNRKYLESRIQDDIRAEKQLEAWLFTTRASI